MYNSKTSISMQTTDKINDNRLKKCVEIAQDTLAVGIETVEELHSQGEKIQNMTDKASSISGRMKYVGRILNKMTSYFGLFMSSPKDTDAYTTNITGTDNDRKYEDDVESPTDHDELDELDELLRLSEELRKVSEEINETLVKQSDSIAELGRIVDKSNYDMYTANARIDKI